MTTLATPLLSMTASDLMSLDPVVISRRMSLRAAAHLLAQADVSGAPVVDEDGACIGVISATDFFHIANNSQKPWHQRTEDPVCAWQMVPAQEISVEEVGDRMTADPVTALASTPIVELAKRMLDAHIHRVIIVDDKKRPIGIVSTTDIVARIGQLN